jgi:putative transposase
VSCRLLGVSRSGFYEWSNRPPAARDEENELLLKHIKQIHADSRGSYGSPRVHAELTLGLGLVVNEKRVARLMRVAGIRGLYVRRRRGCTVRNPAAEPAGDLVNRQFVATAPNRLWVTDITEHPTAEGKLYCAAVLDVYSRRIVGWSMAAHIRTELVLDALGMAWSAAPRRMEKQSCTPTTERNTRPGRSGNDSRRLGCSARWAASVIATTTR